LSGGDSGSEILVAKDGIACCIFAKVRKVAGSSVPEEADLVERITDKALQVQQIDLMERV
jgi:hypothetical protein